MYAKGKKALGICDRCGFTYKLSELKYEIEDKVRNGLSVCSDCFDPDHPQLRVGELQTSDPQSLFNARVDTGEEESTRLFAFDPVGGGITPLGSRTVGLDMGELGNITLSGVVAASPTPSPSPLLPHTFTHTSTSASNYWNNKSAPTLFQHLLHLIRPIQ